MREAAGELERALGTTVTVDDGAAPFADCVRLTITTVGRQPYDEVVHCVDSAFENHGFRAFERGGGLIIARDPAIDLPIACLMRRATDDP
jgi:hypothetical protein